MTVARVATVRSSRRERRDALAICGLYRISREVGRDDGVEVRHIVGISLTKATSAAVTW